MHTRVDPSDALRTLAAGQDGVLSLEQIRLLGLPRASLRRLVQHGHWRRLTSGIYHLGVGEPTWSAKAWAGVLLGGPDARLSGEAAAHLWGLRIDGPDTISVLVPMGRQLADRDCWTFPRERPGVRSAAGPKDPPRTSVADTVVDLCDLAADDDKVVDLITLAVQRRLVTTQQLLACVLARRRVRNRRTMIALLGEVADGAESPLELGYLHDVEQAHDLPTGTRQHRSRGGREVRDVLYEEFATIVELDGLTHALSRLRDLRRDNAALVQGLLTLRYGWPDVLESPCQVAWQVAAVLVARGWTGLPRRCGRCQNASDTDLVLV